MKKLILLLVTCTWASILFSTVAFAESSQKKPSDELVFGILPFLSPVALIKRFSPLREYLEKITGKTIVLESAPNFPEYIKRTLNHSYDLVYTAPHFVPTTLEDGHYKLLAASNTIASHILVKSSSNIASVSQLAGKRIAHGPKQAFLVIIGKYLLKTKGLTGKDAPNFVTHKSHNAALRAVLGDDADAAIVGSFLLKLAKEQGLIEIDATPYYPGIAILASKDVPESLRNQISEAFIDIKKTSEGRETLAKIQFPGFQKTVPADYESLKPIAADAFDMKTFNLANQ